MAERTSRWSSFAHPRYWPSWAGVTLMRAVSLLPLPLISVLGRLLGEALYYLHAERRRIATINIRRCFPALAEGAVRKRVKRHFRALGQALLDIGIGWWASERRLRRLVRFHDREYYDRALAQGKNVILLAPHFLGLEIAGIRLSLEREMITIFRHPDNELLRVVLYQGRARFHLKLVEHNKGLTPLVRQLRAGMPLYYLPDQDAGRRNAAFVPFFGIPTATFTVLGRLAKLAEAVVIPCYARQLPGGKGYEVIFRRPLKNFPSGDLVADAARMNREIEKAVLEMPEQYFWVHKRFKTRPEGEPDFYAR